jgi:hypothetical protein
VNIPPPPVGARLVATVVALDPVVGVAVLHAGATWRYVCLLGDLAPGLTLALGSRVTLEVVPDRRACRVQPLR